VKAEVPDAHLTWQSFGGSLHLNFPTCNTLFAFFMNFTLPTILDLKLVHVNRSSVILWPNRGRGRFKLVLFAQRLFPHNLAQDEADSWLGRGCSSSTQPGNTWLRSCRSTELNEPTKHRTECTYASFLNGCIFHVVLLRSSLWYSGHSRFSWWQRRGVS
jgi:hypothetical protein